MEPLNAQYSITSPSKDNTAGPKHQVLGLWVPPTWYSLQESPQYSKLNNQSLKGEHPWAPTASAWVMGSPTMVEPTREPLNTQISINSHFKDNTPGPLLQVLGWWVPPQWYSLQWKKVRILKLFPTTVLYANVDSTVRENWPSTSRASIQKVTQPIQASVRHVERYFQLSRN